jgi:hypothetical protein
MRSKQTTGNHADELLKKAAKQSSRYPFIAAHRGGPLTKDQHRKLMRWARECSAHVLPLISGNIDSRLVYALQVAKDWESGLVPAGEAMKASLGAHAAAREASNPVSIAVARSIGQGLATAHMADHSVGAALYALKAVKHAGKSLDEEREWQYKQLQLLPSAMMELVVSTMMKKEEHFSM